MYNEKSHRGISASLAILLCIGSIMFAGSAILHATLLNENYTKDKLVQSGFVQQNIKEKLEKTVGAQVSSNIDKDKLNQNVINPLTDNVVNLTMSALYHPEKTQEVESKIREDWSNNLTTILDNNSFLASYVKTVIDSLTTSIVDQIKAEMHIDQLQKIGKHMEAGQLSSIILMIVGGVIALVSLIVLFVLNKQGAITIAFIVSAIFMGLACLAGYFIKSDFVISINNVSTFISFYQSDIAFKFGIAGIIFIVLSIASLVISKIRNR